MVEAFLSMLEGVFQEFEGVHLQQTQEDIMIILSNTK